MFVDEPHVKYGENYTPSTVHFNMVGPKGENKQTTPIWLDISRHIFGFDSFDSFIIPSSPHLTRWCLPFQVDKKGRVKDRSWKSVQKMMTDPGKFLLTLKADVDGMGQRWSEISRSLNDTWLFLAFSQTQFTSTVGWDDLAWPYPSLSYNFSWSLPHTSHSHVGSCWKIVSDRILVGSFTCWGCVTRTCRLK